MPSYLNSDTKKWYCKFYYTDWQGNRQQKKKSGFKLKRDADDFERKFLEYYACDPHVTFEALCDKYETIMKAEWKPTTYNARKGVIENHFLPYFTGRIISEITPLNIKEWHTAMLKDISKNTLHEYHSNLTAIFNFAIKHYGLTKNPCKEAGNIKRIKGEMLYWTIDEYQKAIQDEKIDDTTRIMLKLMFWTGIRHGELLALTPADLNKDSIRINKNRVWTKGKSVVQYSTKNDSARPVFINKELHDDFQAYIDKLYYLDDNSIIFPYSKVKLQYQIDEIAKRTEVKRIVVHGLRHSHVALLIHMGYNPKAIAERIGDSVETVLEVYSHIYKEDYVEMTNRFSELY